MIRNVLKFSNENHWYIIASSLILLAIFWAYGCESHCESLITPPKHINRMELQNEVKYIIGKSKALKADLDKQDQIKQALLDSANLIGSSGTVNPSGLLNIVASVAGISFGLTQRQKAKNATKKSTDAAAQ